MTKFVNERELSFLVPPKKLEPDSHPYRQLLLHVEKHGQLNPILVDKHNRVLRNEYLLMALRHLRIELVQVEVGSLPKIQTPSGSGVGR